MIEEHKSEESKIYLYKFMDPLQCLRSVEKNYYIDYITLELSKHKANILYNTLANRNSMCITFSSHICTLQTFAYMQEHFNQNAHYFRYVVNHIKYTHIEYFDGRFWNLHFVIANTSTPPKRNIQAHRIVFAISIKRSRSSASEPERMRTQYL